MKRVLAHVALLLLARVIVSGAGETPAYRVRLFWRSVPPAVEIAPLTPFSPARAPRLRFEDGGEALLRKPLTLRADDSMLLAGTRYPARSARIVADGEFRLRTPGGEWGTLRGSLSIWSSEEELQLEATLPREEYVKAVLSGEAGGLRQPGALRALAVAIRSYAFASADRHKSEGFDFCDTTHCQDLRLAARRAELDAAVEDTAGELLWHGGVPVAAYHHADSGGRTESAQALWGANAPAWMEGRADPYSNQPAPFTWSVRLAKADVARALRAEGFATTPQPAVTILARTRSGRAARLLAGGREIAAADFRFTIGRQLGWQYLKSDLYDARDDGEFIRFNGRGSGHGVGLSQKGAEEMARQGAGYRQILAFYFPGTQIGVSAQGITWRLLRTERLRFLFAEGAEDRAFTAMASRELARLEAETHYRLRNEWTIRIYPNLDLYRNATGLGGDIAAAAQHREIQFQPLAALRAQSSLAATVRHELAHALLLEESRRPLPEWLQEALARRLSGTPAARTASLPGCAGVRQFEDLERKMDGGAAARREAALVADSFLDLAVKRGSRETVLGWPRTGFPGDHDEVLRRLLREACHE